MKQKFDFKKFSWVVWALIGVALVSFLAIGVIDNDEPLTAAERAASVARTIRCPQCDGETVAESNAPIAQEIRADISRRVSEGQTNQQIRSAMANSYGQDILLLPPGSGIGSSIWIVPIVGLFVAFGILGIAFWRWRFGLIVEEEASSEDIKIVEAEQQIRQQK